jgi:membrane protein DedA with SNARE-associated domain
LSDLIHMLVERFGLVAVFVGCLAEGESAAIFGGFFAHQQVFGVWQTGAVAFTGAFLGDTFLFLAGRRFADHPRVAALRRRPGFSHANHLVETHPNLFVLGNRFIYGLRMVGGIAAGLSSIPISRFLALNAASAAVWAAIFVSIGYFFGLGAETLIGDALVKHERLLIGIAASVAVALLGLWVGRRYLKRNP